MTPTPQINDRSNRVQVTLYERLRKGLVEQDYAPGEHLALQTLAARFGVSVTPVREVLGRLSQEGLVAFVYGKGFFVPQPDFKSCRDVSNAIYMVLEQVARLCVANRGRDEIAGAFELLLEDADRLCASNDAAPERADFEEAALTGLAVLCDNTAMHRMLQTLLIQSRSLRLTRMTKPDEFGDLLDHLDGLCDAMLVGDRAKLESVVRERARRQYERLPAHLLAMISNRLLPACPNAGHRANPIRRHAGPGPETEARPGARH